MMRPKVTSIVMSCVLPPPEAPLAPDASGAPSIRGRKLAIAVI
jgi:hypothetical protein